MTHDPGFEPRTQDGREADPQAHLINVVRRVLTDTLTATDGGTDQDLAVTDASLRAFAAGLSPADLVDAALSAAGQAWDDRPDGPDPARPDAGRLLLRSLGVLLPVLVDRSYDARRELIRHEEVIRREFVDDLLRGDADVAGLVQRAEPFGLDLTLSHQVVLAQPSAGSELHRWDQSRTERAVVAEFGDREVLVTSKNQCLVALVPGPEPGSGPDGAADRLHRDLQREDRNRSWRVAAGRPYPGAYGVARSYEEAREALLLAERLQPELAVVRSRDLLIYRVLGRDKVALDDLVQTVLAPLTGARGGVGPLLATMNAYFEARGVLAETARRLHVSVRTVGYRLAKIHRLTGLDPAEPDHRFTLQAAVLGARLLAWPPEESR